MRLQKIKIALTVLLCLFAGSIFVSCGRAKAAVFSEKAYDYHNKGEYAKAVEMYNKLIALEPENPVNYWDLAIAYADMKDFNAARKQAAKVRVFDAQLADQLDLLIRKSSRGIMYTGRNLRISEEE